ncbi:hypothetical protein MNBD_GAMMA09-981 [hydrothermal vent metagenome]|uniref:RNA polymerase ECF-type sigma factor n=1 Tax=hydrothermal vent metagenome TaxID=652676 RepID=A0A3B0Y8E2_9ZZZZ
MFNKEELNQLYRYALSLATQEDTACDLVQEALLRYLKKYPPNHAIDKPLAYLKTIIRNLYFDLQRHNKVVPMVSANSEDILAIEPIDSFSIEEMMVNQQEVQRLLNGLSDEENELLYLWAVEEHTAEEIARIYEKPRGTILSSMHRLKKRIRQVSDDE